MCGVKKGNWTPKARPMMLMMLALGASKCAINPDKTLKMRAVVAIHTTVGSTFAA